MSETSTKLLDAAQKRIPSLRASANAADRVAYSRDLWPRHHLAVRAGNVGEHKPGIIVWPTSTAEVVEVVRFANETSTPIVPFGAGSGVCAGILPTEDSIVIDLKRMTKWRDLDRRAPSINVESGQMGMPFEEELNRKGFTLGHFPSSILCSTVGGWVAARSAGQCSGKYGKIEDMVLELECVTGKGEVVTLKHRSNGPNLIPMMVGSEGTLAVITSNTLRLHPVPTSRAFAAWSFPSTEHGWEAMRAMFQSGLRPAVLRLYDPFDAMLARMGSVKKSSGANEKAEPAPGVGGRVLRAALKRANLMNSLVDNLGTKVFGPALLLTIYEGEGSEPSRECEDAERVAKKMGGTALGEGPARKWLEHRYSVSYRQAPVFENGMFSDTMEVAAPWSKLGALYDGVRKALGKNVFVMAHLSHAYPDGCCIYFSFAGTAAKDSKSEWNAACEVTYDRTWRAALAAAVDAGGTLAHHHGVGRSKAPRLAEELGGAGIDAVRALKRAFDPNGILNPGNLIPPVSPEPYSNDAFFKTVRS